PTTETTLVTPGYFKTLEIPLSSGRLFTDHDDDRSPFVVVVSDAFARRFFPNQDPIGKRIAPGVRVGNGPVQAAPNWVTIVGRVADVKTNGLEADAAAMVYRSALQLSNLSMTLVVRSDTEASALAESIRREVRGVDPNEPVFAVRTMDQVVAAALGQRRF